MNQPALPAFLQQRQSKAIATTLAGNLGQGSPPYVSIMGNRFTLVDAVGNEIPVETYDPKTGPYLDAVIIDSLQHISKIYFDKPFDPSQQQWLPPICFSDNGIAPSRNASSPQSPTCASCPKSAWGSKTSPISGKGIKACADFQKVALLVPGNDVIFLLRVPPNSLSKLREYVHRFNGQQVDISDVITRISFEQGTLGTLVFNAVNYIDQPVFEKREAALQASATDNLIGRNDQPHPGVAAVADKSGYTPESRLVVPGPQGFQPTNPTLPAPAQSAGLPAMQPATQPASAAAATASISPSNPPAAGQPAQRRRRRTQAEIAAANAQNGPAPAATAPFMPQPTANAPLPPSQPAPSFGISPGVPPNPELSAALSNLFKQN